MAQKISIYGPEQVQEVAQELCALMDRCAVFTFTGDLGAGKTTLVQSMLRQCGINEVIASPTFTYVNSYTNERGQQFHHFDLYRIGSQDDFLAAGFDEYLYAPNSWAFIEWPAPILPLLDHAVCHVAIDYYNEGEQRIITLTTIT